MTKKTAMVKQIKNLLLNAANHDAQARKSRALAGKLIAKLRATPPASGDWYKLLGLDKASAERLIEMGVGAEVQPRGITQPKIFDKQNRRYT